MNQIDRNIFELSSKLWPLAADHSDLLQAIQNKNEKIEKESLTYTKSLVLIFIVANSVASYHSSRIAYYKTL